MKKTVKTQQFGAELVWLHLYRVSNSRPMNIQHPIPAVLACLWISALNTQTLFVVQTTYWNEKVLMYKHHFNSSQLLVIIYGQYSSDYCFIHYLFLSMGGIEIHMKSTQNLFWMIESKKRGIAMNRHLFSYGFHQTVSVQIPEAWCLPSWWWFF